MFDRPPQTPLTEGMIVVYRTYGTFSGADTWGRITKVTPKGTVTFKYGDKEKTFRPPYRDLRIPTDHEVAMRKWSVVCPKVEFVGVFRGGFTGDNGELRVEFNHRTDGKLPDGVESFEDLLTKGVEELTKIRNWYATKPKRPRSSNDE